MKQIHTQITHVFDLDEYKQQVQELQQLNGKLQQQNYDLIREVTHYQIMLRDKDLQIEQLRKENSGLKFELQLCLKQQPDDLFSAISLDRYRNVSSTIQPKRKRIFETKKTTLHMNYLSPKKHVNDQDDVPDDGQEIRKKKYSEDEIHQVVVQEVQVQDYHETNDMNARVDHIIQKYSKNKLEQCKGELSNGDSQTFEVPKQFVSQQQPTPLHKLFEEFLIISVTKQTLNNLSNSIIEEREATLRPEILFQHSSKNSSCHEQIQLLPQQIHPYGLKVKLEEKTLSMSNLNSILMGGQSYDRLAGAYVISMKSEQTFNSSLQPAALLKFNPDNVTELISATNLQHQLYCVCVDVPDFYDYNICDSKNNLKRKYFYLFTKTYCFITKTPIIDFFIEIIKIIISILLFLLGTLKYKKAEIYSMVTEIEETLQNIDNSFYTVFTIFIQSFKPELYNFLTLIQNAQYISQCNYQFLQTPIRVPLFHCNEPGFFEIEWAVSYAFCHMDLPHYLVLLINMLLEQNICIISSNRTLLSALLMVLPHTIAPFQHIHPIIFALTNQLMPMLDSPVPFLCGMVKDPEVGLQHLGIEDDAAFFEEQQQVIFFNADKLKFYNSEDYTKCQVHQTLLYKLFQIYSQIKQQNVPGHFLAENNEATLNLSFQVLIETKNYINENILSLLQYELGDSEQIQQAALDQTQDEIFKRIIKTQYFSYFLQQKIVVD